RHRGPIGFLRARKGVPRQRGALADANRAAYAYSLPGPRCRCLTIAEVGSDEVEHLRVVRIDLEQDVPDLISADDTAVRALTGNLPHQMGRPQPPIGSDRHTSSP